MNTPHAHRFNSSALERQSDSSAPPRPPPRPGWSWLPFVGVGAALLLLRTLGARGKSTNAHAFSYSAFLSQVQSNHIRSAVINPAGAVSGTLTNGTGYTSQIPAALPDPQLPGLNEAATVAVRDDRDVIVANDLDEARVRILLGPRELSNALLPGEQRAVAIHEAGHALVALCSEHADPVAKVTILPAGRFLGLTQQLPTDERHLYSESYLHDSLAVRLGGRAAELLVLGEASTGAASDLAGATELATRMVRDWGFSTRLGPVGFGSEGPAYLGHQPTEGRPYAEETQLVIDEEVSRILSEAGERAHSILSERRASLDTVIDLLLEKETISGVELSGRGAPVS